MNQDEFKTATEMKKIAQFNRMQQVDIEKRVAEQIKNANYFIESAVKRGRFETSVILNNEVKSNEEIYDKMIIFLKEKGYKVDVSLMKENLLKISWE